MRDAELAAAIAEFQGSDYGRLLDRSYVPDNPRYLAPFVERAQNGDDAARAHVYDGMSQLVYRQTITYLGKWQSHLPSHTSVSDVFASGLAGLQRGINDFDLEHGHAFTTYATWWVRNGVQNAIYDLVGSGAIRAKALSKGVDPLDPLVGSSMMSLEWHGEETDSEFHELVAAEADEEFDVELVQHILELLSSIDSRLPMIVDLIDRNHAMKEISRIVGISVPRVKALLERAQDELADYS